MENSIFENLYNRTEYKVMSKAPFLSKNTEDVNIWMLKLRVT
jgi:hypothetical protein